MLEGCVEQWMVAVDLGGRGYAARALTLLDALARDVSDDAIASLALSTRGSLVRQAGRHRDALVFDGAALARADPGAGAPADEPVSWHRAAVVDALVGAAADNLGRFRFGASARLLDRARPWLRTTSGPGDDWTTDTRVRLRWEWVTAEFHLYSGRPDEAARHASRAQAVVDAAAGVPVRHRIKTELIGAAGVAAAGDVHSARAIAASCREQSATHGLLPLEWASLSLLAGVGAGDEVTMQRAAVRDELIRRGMPFDRRR